MARRLVDELDLAGCTADTDKSISGVCCDAPDGSRSLNRFGRLSQTERVRSPKKSECIAGLYKLSEDHPAAHVFAFDIQLRKKRAGRALLGDESEFRTLADVYYRCVSDLRP